MVTKKNCVAMLLAGGQGSRLGVLTKGTAKPAVNYGGKYKIIDFPLSNCIHSGIDTVGVLTQYQPLELNSYIGTGAPWDLDCMYGGAYVLPPYEKSGMREWYKGTANAIFQNIDFIDKHDPKYLLVLSGDHIYKMQYNKMIEAHAKNGADCTIAVIEVPFEEASRFGIMNTDETMRIIEFEEKPPVPKSNLASMGVYCFSWQKLRAYLIADNEDSSSENDFGKNIIPNMLGAGEKLFAYSFHGYWKDVGTIDSLWEANMELLGENPALDLYEPSWRIYSRNPNKPPHFIFEKASVKNSIISEGCFVYGHVENSILFSGVFVEYGAVIKDSIIMPETTIHEYAEVYKSIVDEEVNIGKRCVIGGPNAITVIGHGANISDDTTIQEGDGIPSGSKI